MKKSTRNSGNKADWSESNVRRVVAKNTTHSDMLIDLGLKGSGSSRRNLKKYIRIYKIDTSHIMGTGSGPVQKKKPLHPLSAYTINGKIVDGRYLKRRLVAEGIIDYECVKCHLTDWQGQYIALHLDHINGNNVDNRLENLRLLCPNCHSQTPTYCGKNVPNVATGTFSAESVPNVKDARKPCPGCNGPMKLKSILCKTCSTKVFEDKRTKTNASGKVAADGPGHFLNIAAINEVKQNVYKERKTIVNWPPIEEVVDIVKKLGWAQAGKKLGASDNAVRKHLRARSVDISVVKKEKNTP